MTMKLAIHHKPGSYSERWVKYCDEHAIAYKIVNCLNSDIMRQLVSVQGLLWHWYHFDPKEVLVAGHVIMAAEAMGLKVFPSTCTCWHYDDKVAQKYLLEALGAPLVPTCVFFGLGEALDWIERASFPKVFKLRRGAGSANVRLVRDAHQARALVRQAFSSGFKPIEGYSQDARRRLREVRQRGDWLAALRRLPATVRQIRRANRLMGREIGYVYFQDFAPDNQFDIRVTVIGNRAFAYTRNVRPGDFRASGSGEIVYDLQRIHPQCVPIAFDVAKRVRSQSLAFDFVVGPAGKPQITEICFAFKAGLVYSCPGHWDDTLHWHEEHVWPQDAMLIDLIEDVRRDLASPA